MGPYYSMAPYPPYILKGPQTDHYYKGPLNRLLALYFKGKGPYYSKAMGGSASAGAGSMPTVLVVE
jgi:hypothetical protein